MPEQIDLYFRQFHRRRQDGEAERLFATSGKSFGHCCQQVRTLEYVADRDEMRNLQAYVSLDAFPCEEGIDDAVSCIRRYHTNVVIAAKTLERQRFAGGWMALAA